jgi:tripartite-type tricarboxylate transporter receptor subunit TctC
MKFLSRRVFYLAAGLAALAAIGLSPQHARPETARSLKIVVASAPGGVNDILARLLGEQIGRAQGITTVVDNRPGAGEIIGTESVMRAAPDGGTILIAANPFVINPSLRKTNYDPLTSFEPICELVTAPTLIVVNSDSPYRTLGDVFDAARAKPGTLTLASIGPGSPFQLGFEMLRRAAKVDMTFVPYQGNGPSVNALLGGHVTAMFGTYSNVAGNLKNGRLRAIVATTPARIEALPDLPTLSDVGFKGFEVDAWFGAFAPAKTPPSELSRLGAWLNAALRAPEVMEKLSPQSLFPSQLCGADYAAYLRKQFDSYARIIREANIKAE